MDYAIATWFIIFAFLLGLLCSPESQRCCRQERGSHIVSEWRHHQKRPAPLILSALPQLLHQHTHPHANRLCKRQSSIELNIHAAAVPGACIIPTPTPSAVEPCAASSMCVVLVRMCPAHARLPSPSLVLETQVSVPCRPDIVLIQVMQSTVIIHGALSPPARPSPSVSLALFLSLNRLLRHLNQAVLGLAVRKVGNRGNGPVRVVVREGTRLLDAVALEHQLTRLHGPVSHTRLAPTESKWPRNHTFSTSPSRSNLRPTSAPSSGFCFHANSRGAVASPSSRSAPAGLPRSLPLRV